ncbi:MAG: exodeoxyribonuclease III [Flavobacteriaceae bacterium]
MRIATWNINSVRLRIDIVADFVARYRPDILCLQEIKCIEDAFPLKRLRSLGFDYVGINGQKGYHGVATMARLPGSTHTRHDFCQVGDARHLASDFEIGGKRLRVHNFYVPAGGDEPDPAINLKFAHKLSYLAEMRQWAADGQHIAGADHAILLGDLNIAPHEDDVWSHRQLLNVVSHTPVETQGLLAIQAAGHFTDLAREEALRPESLYTWWSYRARDWEASNRGRRLDHIWTSPDLSGHCRGFSILAEARGWPRPSDHVPVIADFDL